MSHHIKNLIRSLFFAITFLSLWQYSNSIAVPRVQIHEQVSETVTQFSTKLYKYYAGCYSTRNLQEIVSEKSHLTKFIFYRPKLIQEECFNSCQLYFEGFPSSLLNIIAIQYHLCMCIPIYSGEHSISLYKVTDSHCNLTSDSDKEKSLSVGGKYSFALYSKDNENYISFFLIHDLFKISQVESLEDNEQNSDLSEVSGDVYLKELQPCLSEECTLRLNMEGEICNTTISIPKDNIQRSHHTETTLLPFYNGYLPKSTENPYLCLKYCSHRVLGQSPDLYTMFSENPTKDLLSKYSIQSTTFWASPLHEPIEFCHCTDTLSMTYPVGIEKCLKCPISWNEKQRYCESFDFRHRIYDNAMYGERIRRSTTVIPENFDISAEINKSAMQFRSSALICPEAIRCKAKDSYGREWEACPLDRVSGTCPISSEPGATAFWNCGPNGTFIGEEPNFDNCTSQDLLQIENSYNRTEFGPNSHKRDKEVLVELRNLVTTQKDAGAKYFGHDIERIHGIVENVARSQSPIFEERESITTEAIEVLGNLIATSAPWTQLNTRSRSTTATNLFTSVENTLFRFADASEKEMSNKGKDGFYRKTVNPITKDHGGFVVTLGARKKNIGENIKFPAESDSSYIKILNNPQLQQQDIKFVGMIMESKYVDKLNVPNFKQESEPKKFNGKIISLTFSDDKISQMATGKGFQIKFAHEVKAIGAGRTDFRRKLHPGEERKYVLGETKCAYWDTKSLLWSTNGCRKLEDPSNSQETVCECNHLTAFAVLTDVHGYIGKDKGLEILTLILCPLSIFCLIATIVVLSRMKVLHGERTTITKHLCVNLIIGNVLLLLLVDRNYFFLPQIGCTAVGIITHYVFLAAFGWMAVQGLYLYRMVVLVFDSGKNYMPYYTIGAYCYPLIPIALTAGIGYGVGDLPYGGEMYCWLNGDYIWAFMGPIAVILFGNFIVMVLTMRRVHKQQNSKFRSHNQIKSNRKWIQGCCALSVLLGLTWIIGFFTLLDDPSFYFFSYVFTIANSSQGVFILIFYCLLHEKVKPLVLDKMGIVGSIFSKKDSSSSAKFSKQTSSTKLPDTHSRTETENQSEGDGFSAVPEEDETEDPNENCQETSQLGYYDEDLNEPGDFPRRVLSTVLETNSESESEESENDLLSENRGPRPKPRRQGRIEEENESEDNSEEDESIDFDQVEHQEPKKRERRYKGPPYMDELLESNLYLRYSRCDAERSLDE